MAGATIAIFLIVNFATLVVLVWGVWNAHQAKAVWYEAVGRYAAHREWAKSIQRHYNFSKTMVEVVREMLDKPENEHFAVTSLQSMMVSYDQLEKLVNRNRKEFLEEEMPP
jgi:hypothetical protein